MAFDVGSVVAHVKADVTDFKNGINSAKEQVGGLGNTMNGVANTIKTGFLVASAAAAAGMVLIGKSALQAAGDFEQTKIAFETMLGSTSKAAKLITDLQTFAKKTPFNLVELQETTKRLLAYGVEADNVIGTLTTLGNIASGVGRDKMPQLTLAFGQVKAVGHLTGMELRQFSETGVPLLGILADNFKVTTAEMQDMISAGEIGFPAVQTALESLGGEGGKWGDLMDKQSKTMQGSLSNLQDAWTQLLVILGTFFIPVATEVIQTLTNFLGPLVSIIQTSTSWQEALTKMGFDTQQFQTVVDAVIKWFNDTAMPAIQIFLNWWSANWQMVALQFKGIWDIIAGIVRIGWAIIYGIISAGLEILAGDWRGAWTRIKEAAGMAWEGIKGIFNGIIEFLGGWGGQLYNEMTKPFRDAWNTIQDLMKKIKGAIDPNQRHSPSMVDRVKKGVKDLNDAWGQIEFSASITKESAAVSVSNAGPSTQVNSIQVNLEGAMISDEGGAQRMAEIVGDNIIKRLQANVRF